MFFGGIVLSSIGVFSQSDSTVTSVSTTSSSQEKQASADEQTKFRLDDAALTPPQVPFIKIEEKKKEATGEEKEKSQKEETEEVIPAEKK